MLNGLRLCAVLEREVIRKHDQQRESDQTPVVHARDVANRHGDRSSAGRSEVLSVDKIPHEGQR
jgi:hypothetical protein